MIDQNQMIACGTGVCTLEAYSPYSQGERSGGFAFFFGGLLRLSLRVSVGDSS